MSHNISGELPNPFIFENGKKVTNQADWQDRRQEIAAAIIPLQYGGMPPVPAKTELEILHESGNPGNGGRYLTCRVKIVDPPTFSFLTTMLIPAGEGPFPLVINGDACWRYLTDDIAAEIIANGMILAQFNRVEIAADNLSTARDNGIYLKYPAGEFGALAAWAWGYHRVIDALQNLSAVDQSKIAVFGHSRGGKASLLAGATDERIALTAANDSGAGGAGCYRWQGEDSERLADHLANFPYWFGQRLKEYIGREAELPFDQHYLKSLVAPRALFTTEALADLWANPSGTWQTHMAAHEVYQFLQAEERIGICYREGEHAHTLQDWQNFLAFARWQFQGGAAPAGINENPFPNMPAAFSWHKA